MVPTAPVGKAVKKGKPSFEELPTSTSQETASATNMFKWLKDKAVQVAANQSRSSIALDVRRLVAVSNEVEEYIDQIGEPHRSDVERVVAAQHQLLDDITLGLSNRLSIKDIESRIGEALAQETVGDGARMAVNHILNHVRSANSSLRLP